MLVLLALAASSVQDDCRAELERVAAEARDQGYEAVQGPYEVAPGDVRVHAVHTEAGGHRIVEHRCADGRVVSRSWTARWGDEVPTPLESILRDADWPQQERGE